MIKLRVEWHHKCHKCGIELVADFLDDPKDELVCPWCGSVCACNLNQFNQELRNYIAAAVKEIESIANDKIPIN